MITPAVIFVRRAILWFGRETPAYLILSGVEIQEQFMDRTFGGYRKFPTFIVLAQRPNPK